MSHSRPIWALALCCAASFPTQSLAQTPAAKRTPTTKEHYTPKVPTEYYKSTVTAQRQQAAISIINKLVDESESYQDQTLRIRVQARAADALWDTNEKRAGKMFMHAWEIAEKVDKDGERNAEEARKRFMSSRDGEMILIPRASNLRAEVLSLAAQRDDALGERLLALLDNANEQEPTNSDPQNITASFFDPTQPKLAIAKRLELAVQLLEAGEVKRAKSYADSALNYATSQGIIFLCALRQREAEDADKLFARLLTFAANDPSADATTVSLLSSYAFTPNFLVTATRRARVSRQLSETGQTYGLSPELRAGFFSVAAKILLRPIPVADQDHTSAGPAGTYFTIARLLPLFQQYAASNVPALNVQLALLSPQTPEAFKNGEEAMLKVGLVPARSSGDELSGIFNKLVGTVNSSERDALYVNAIRIAATKDDAGVREFAEKIEDAKLREQARAFADLAAVRSAIRKKDVDGGLRVVRGNNLSPLHRVWARVQLASLLKKTDPALNLQLINEAAEEANRISLGESERVYAFVCVAMSVFDVDRQRSWELADEAVKGANAVADFSGEDGKLTARLRARDVVAMINSGEPSFNMVNLFVLLAKDDIDRANSITDKLVGVSSRASANLAIARSILSRPKTSTDSSLK